MTTSVAGPMFGSPWPLRLCEPRGKPAGSHYTCNAIEGDAMNILREFTPDDLNWVFLATSGVHGSYTSLDDAEADLRLWETDRAGWATEHWVESPDEMPDAWSDEITCLIVMPRIVSICYGNATVRNRDDINCLRPLVAATLVGVNELQKGCFPK